MKILFSSLILVMSTAQAGVVTLDNHELGEINGQGGADLSWSLSLNHKLPTDPTKISYEYSCDASSAAYCRLAISPNNRTDKNKNMQWLVFKQIQGTLQIDKFQLDGVSLNTGSGERTALQLKFLEEYPLKLRNFGYAALQIETDKGATAAEKGYLNTGTYVDPAPSQAFDFGSEKGFTGLNIHGNLGMAGTIKVFGCNPSGNLRC